MIVGPPPFRPVEFALALGNRHIVDAGMAQRHQAGRVEFPVLLAVRAKPVACIVVPFIRKAYGDAVSAKLPGQAASSCLKIPRKARQYWTGA